MSRGAGDRDSIFHSRTGLGTSGPGPADRLFMLAEACRNSGRLGPMAALLTKYIGLNTGRPETAVALALTGRYSEALARSAAILRSPAATPEEISFLGNPWVNISEKKFLRAALKAVLRAKPRGEACRLRALHLFILRARTGAKEGRPPAFRGRLSIMNIHAAQVLLEKLRTGEAAQLMTETVKNFPLDELACGTLAEALLFSGMGNNALELMKKSAPLISSPGFHAWRGQLLLTCGRYSEAASILAGKPASLSPMSRCWRGAALLRLGRTAQALRVLRQAVREAPSDSEARLWLAEALRLSGQKAASLQACETVLQTARTNPWALLTAALLYHDKDRKKSARLFNGFSRGHGRLLGAPGRPYVKWAGTALGGSDCRRPEPHFLMLAGRRLVSGIN